MIVEIHGASEEQKEIITDLSNFAMKKMMPRAWADLYLFVEIDSELFDREGTLGDCTWEGSSKSPRDFIIRLDGNLPKDELLLTLAHELVHVKQYAKNELKQFCNLRGYRFKNDLYPLDYAYSLRPWEIEASVLESTLVESWEGSCESVLS